MFAVEAAHQHRRLRKGRTHHFGDARGRGAVVHADRDHARPAGAGGMQHVEPGAIAVINLETEVGGAGDHADVVVDDRHVHAAGQQGLARHLAEATEADHEHAALQAVRRFHARQRGRHRPEQQPLNHQHHQRREHHRQHHDGRQVGMGPRVEQAAAEYSTKANSPPCAISTARSSASACELRRIRATA